MRSSVLLLIGVLGFGCTGSQGSPCSAGFVAIPGGLGCEPEGGGGQPRPTPGGCIAGGFEQVGALFLSEHQAKDIVVHDETLYVASGDEGLLVYDISTPDTPVLVAQLELGPVRRVDIHRGWLFASTDSVAILNIDDPHAPTEIASLNVLGAPSAISFEAGFAFVLADGLQIFNVDDPSSPTTVGWFDASGVAIEVRQGLAYIVQISALTIVDVTQPTQPEPMGSFAFTDPMGWGSSIVLIDNLAYVGARYPNLDWGRIITFDVSDPSNPEDRDLSFLFDDGATDIATDGRFLFVSASTDRVYIFDTLNRVAPRYVTHVGEPGLAVGLTLSESFAYVANHDRGVFVIDVSDPASASVYPTTLSSFGPTSARLAAGLAYATDPATGLWLLDVSDPDQIVTRGRVDLPADEVAVDGDIACVTNFEGLSVVDVSDPGSPRVLSTINLPGLIADVELREGIAYVAARSRGLLLVDISDASAPVLMNWIEMDDVARVELQEGIAFVAGDRRGDAGHVTSVDISDPANLAVVDSLDMPFGVFDLIREGDTLYAAMFQRALGIVDMSDPGSLVMMNAYPMLEEIRAVAAEGTTAYVMSDRGTLVAIDVSVQPPTEVAFELTSGAAALTASEGRLHLWSQEGLQIVVPEPCAGKRN